MDLTDDGSSHERPIKDYLSGAHGSTACQMDSDGVRQFARPIEDEDIFGLVQAEERSRPSKLITESTDAMQPLDGPASSDLNSEQMNLKYMKLRQAIKEQTLAKGIVPKRFRSGDNSDGMVHIDSEESCRDPVPPARLIFQHAQEKRTKDQYGLYRGQKLKWDVYNDYLKKTICSNKRKRWDSLHAPSDRYDEEEELVDGEDELNEAIEVSTTDTKADESDQGEGIDDDERGSVDEKEESAGESDEEAELSDAGGEFGDVQTRSKGKNIIDDDEED